MFIIHLCFYVPQTPRGIVIIRPFVPSSMVLSAFHMHSLQEAVIPGMKVIEMKGSVLVRDIHP